MTPRTRTRIALAAIAGALLLGGAACSDDNGGAVDTGAGTTAGSGGAEIVIQDIAYPDSMTAAAGATVTVTNKDGVPHTVTADDDSFNAAVDENGTATFTAPAEPGSYPVHCNVHPTMKGTLEVT
jgi:plastocyanin